VKKQVVVDQSELIVFVMTEMHGMSAEMPPAVFSCRLNDDAPQTVDATAVKIESRLLNDDACVLLVLQTKFSVQNARAYFVRAMRLDDLRRVVAESLLLLSKFRLLMLEDFEFDFERVIFLFL